MEPEPKASRRWSWSQKLHMPGVGTGAGNMSTGCTALVCRGLADVIIAL